MTRKMHSGTLPTRSGERITGRLRRNSALKSRYRPHLAPRGPRRPPEERRFEVVDLRLVPARLEGEASGWLAYGTSAQEGESIASTTIMGAAATGKRRSWELS